MQGASLCNSVKCGIFDVIDLKTRGILLDETYFETIIAFIMHWTVIDFTCLWFLKLSFRILSLMSKMSRIKFQYYLISNSKILPKGMRHFRFYLLLPVFKEIVNKIFNNFKKAKGMPPFTLSREHFMTCIFSKTSKMWHCKTYL